MCGEKIYSVRDNIAEQGSPPHVRGKARKAENAIRNQQDHPRMCGEKSIH